MKVLFILMSLCLLAFTAAGAEEKLPEFTNVEVANNSRELDWLIKGGNKNLYLVNFYMPGDDHEEVKKDLQRKVLSHLNTNSKKYNDKVTYVEINAARTYQYKEILQDVGIYNEPSRMYPYILLIQGGEGYIFRGANIGDLVYRKLQAVMEGHVNFDSLK